MLLGGTYPALMALGMLKAAPAYSFEPKTNLKGKKILILGAGLCGMTAAYELQKLGYDCTILEARDRTGGRCWSVRKDSNNQEIDSPKQISKFDEGQYFNAGPSRIPHHHQLTLQYCKELNVPLQIYNNVNEGSYYFAEGKGPLSNKKIKTREVHNDMRGYMSELLYKSISQDKLDLDLSKDDVEKVLEYLRAEGGLDIDNLYKASARRGYVNPPSASNQSGTIGNAFPLADILSSGLADPDFYNVAEYTYELQMTMFQAVGGMDKIASALEAKVGNLIKKSAEVTSIKNLENSVKVVYKDGKGLHEIEADICICTIPLKVLSNLEHNFSSNISRAIDYASYINTGKIGLQFKRRFWEEDEQIYGGITHTNNQLTQIFYPSNDYHSKKGVLLGYYNFNDKAIEVGALSYSDREKLALEKGALIHPQYPKEFENSFSVSWHKTPYNLGGWALYSSETRESIYKPLLKPEKQVYFAGEHMTYLNAWMAGAFESARSVVMDINNRVNERNEVYKKAED
ncbi:amine oxidase [Pedobacter psychrophilus]|uniref:Tryptophan 2-monooxygenase n=2 Tax=Pedobacter psychrophilus TaxID=1826909 RepID=A0A179DMX1_9SPHI|nr:amine oxidase [Pedobacter psychrophilus]